MSETTAPPRCHAPQADRDCGIGHTRGVRPIVIAAIGSGLAIALCLASHETPAVGGRAPAPPAGNPNGHAPVPAAARAVDTSHPTRVVGNGTRESCTSNAVRRAIRLGGKITFDCGPGHATIRMTRTANVRNDQRPNVVVDGGGKITLSGAGKRRIIYMNTCDPKLGITTPHCNDQATPRLVLQNITLANGNSTGLQQEGGGGGAVFVRGGRVKVVNSRFFNNRCDRTGPDLGGAAIRVLDQFKDEPVYIVHSTFGGAPGYGGRCSNGGALSSIGVSWVVINSLITNNRAIGTGANPPRPGTPGGGSGGGIYNDGNRFRLALSGTAMRDNHAREGGGAIFFVSNDRTGTLTIAHSRLHHNPSARFETPGYPGIFFLGRGHPRVRHSQID
jgi:hypothetical protein